MTFLNDCEQHSQWRKSSSCCVGVLEFVGLAHLINGVTAKSYPLPALYCRPEVPQEIP